MLLFLPFRLLRLALLGPRIMAAVMLHPRFRTMKLALVMLGIAALVTYFGRSRKAGPRA